MDKFAKAIGAASGGVTAFAGVSALAAIFLTFVPEATRADIPWWGYVVIISLAAFFCIVFPALQTYLAPANTPQDLPAKIDVPVNVPVDIEKVGDTVRVAKGK